MKITSVKLTTCLIALLLLTAGLVAQASLAPPQPSVLTQGGFINQTVQVVKNGEHTLAANVAKLKITSHISTLQKIDNTHGLSAVLIGSKALKPAGSIVNMSKGHSAAIGVLQGNTIASEVKQLSMGKGNAGIGLGWGFSTNSLLSHSESLLSHSKNFTAHLFEEMGGELNGFELPPRAAANPKVARTAHHKLTMAISQAQKKTLLIKRGVSMATLVMRGSNPGAGFCQQHSKLSAASAYCQTFSSVAASTG